MRILATLAIIAPLVASAATPSIEDFVGRAAYSGARISPTGEYLAMTVDRGEQDVLAVLRTKDLSLVKVNQIPDSKSVGAFYWVGPERLMFTSIRKVGTFAQPFGTGEWYAVNADGTQARPLIFYGTRDVTQRSKTVGNQSFSFLDALPEDPSKVLMTVTYPRSVDGAGTELVRLDTLTGRRKVLSRAPRENCSLTLDAKKQARFALCFDSEDEQGRYDTVTELYRREADGAWTLINKASSAGKELRVVGTTPEGRIYAYQGDRKAPDAFGVLDEKTGAFTSLFQDPIAEVSRLILAADQETVIAVVTEAGVPQVTMIDEEHPDAALYASLGQAFAGQMINFSSATADWQQIVVSVYSDRNPGELYLYDRKEGKARFLMAGRAHLDPAQMARIKPIILAARDGLKLHGYLTLPHGRDPKQLPLIVNPHGGPMGPRDNWGFNPEAQLFASRGYAVLQVNFRGSGGYGKAFMDQAYGQWRTGIQNDIIDATRYVIEQGYVDKDRVCIYGGSFGGYSALMAPAIAPELFSCAFGYVGMYDAALQMKLSDTSESADGMRYLKRALGETEAERTAMSPITYVDQLKLPIAMAAGARDPRCPPQHTVAMREALEKAGNPPEHVIIQSGEMHGFYDVENRVNLYTTMLAFFDRHIGHKGEVEVGQPSSTGSAP